MKMRLSVLFLALLASSATAAEPAVRDGLILWVDAAAQTTRRLQPVDMVVDTSSRGQRGFQLVPERRPILVSDGQTAFFKFDGKDDFLAFTGKESASELTLFVLAAPKSNPGNFTALFGAAPMGKNDFNTGLNLDFGPGATKELSVVNVESAGAMGFRDLLGPGFLNAAERPFGGFHVFTLRAKNGKGGIEVFLDGFKGGARDRTESAIGLDHIIIGARLYSNDPGQPPYVQGNLEGAIAEVLLYNRALSEGERRSVEQALLAKTVALHALLSGAKGHALETVKDPPPVQMLVPGFTVHELPLKIGNLNNVRYRHDGKLVGLGYDGRIHLLTDTDGDGLEDRSEFFWEERTLRAPIGMEVRSNSVFVASKGKVSLITDKDGDRRADEEKVLATGWTELPHGVDTLGLAIDPKDGAVYFGLGCANFADGYLIDRATGKSQYSLESIRGTIQRISPDFSKRETVCTGVRFACALAFNERGDLFATDQEGATWLANGNPLDELLHIEKGKHYGFPPRHPKYLPNVRDEPAVIEYGPQHQSTVGMVFNTGFGPAHWRGDALVCGESRGKLWRTKLAKTPFGYVAQNHLIACLGLLTVDACVSPQGDLVVACHSGPPDWGTGPAGEGRIFKIRYTGTSLPQPVLAWAAGPDEFRIAFDQTLDPADWAKARDQIRIEAGQHVSAGDRFEVIRPGYQVVRDQMTQPRRWVDVLGLSLTEDRRTMVLRVPRQTEAVTYAITLPLPDSWRQRGGIAQHPQIDVALTLNGVLAMAGDRRCVLPHPSVAASKIFTAGSAEHQAFLKEPRITARTLVDRSDPFVPAVQPGSKLDWEQVAELFEVRGSAISGDNVIEFALSEDSHIYLGKNDVRHPISTTRVYVPWAIREPQPATIAQTRTDVKGHWLRGRRVFFTDGGCATCHTIRSEGTAFGPDLSNLIHRDRDSVLQDAGHPAALGDHQSGPGGHDDHAQGWHEHRRHRARDQRQQSYRWVACRRAKRICAGCNCWDRAAASFAHAGGAAGDFEQRTDRGPAHILAYKSARTCAHHADRSAHAASAAHCRNRAGARVRGGARLRRASSHPPVRRPERPWPGRTRLPAVARTLDAPARTCRKGDRENLHGISHGRPTRQCGRSGFLQCESRVERTVCENAGCLPSTRRGRGLHPLRGGWWQSAGPGSAEDRPCIHARLAVPAR
jgi:glucose/arabinose dehydrogenase